MSSLTAATTTTSALIMILAACGGSSTGESLEESLARIVAAYPHATIAVAVRDLATGYHADVNGDTLMHAASTMKVPVLIEVYRQADAGRLSLDDSIEVRNEFTSIYDGSPFTVGIEDDSDKTIYEAVGGKMTVRDLSYRLITSSSNLATNLLVDLVSADSVQKTIEGLGVRRMKVLRGVEDLKAFEAGMNNVATATDLAVLLEAILEGRAGSESACKEMIDVLADVPSFHMISSGVPKGSRVAHKTGSIPTRNHRHDAAIVFPPAGSPYVIAIMTRDTKSTEEAEEVGRQVSQAVYQHLRG